MYSRPPIKISALQYLNRPAVVILLIRFVGKEKDLTQVHTIIRYL